MSELRDVLEHRRHDFAPPPGGLTRLASMRRRRRMRRQAAIAGLALLLAAGALYGVSRAFLVSAPQHHVPAGPLIHSSTVSGLRVAWTASSERGSASSVTVGISEVYVRESLGELRAYSRSCRAQPCPASWTTTRLSTQPIAPHGVSTAPLVSGSRVFVTSDRLEAFPVRCATGGRGCPEALVEMPPILGRVLTSPVLSHGTLYVGTYGGQVLGYRADCRKATGCGPVWSASTGGSLLGSAPAVADGLVYAVSDRLYAFRVGCSDLCAPEWTAAGAGTTETSVPAARNGMVFVAQGDTLSGFSATCGSGGAECRPAWTFRDPGGVDLSTPALGDGQVYVAGSKLFALPASCRADCRPAWSGSLVGSVAASPEVIGDLVFVAGSEVAAFPARCSRPCRALWRSGPLGAQQFDLAVTPSAVYVTSTDGELRAFEVASTPG